MLGRDPAHQRFVPGAAGAVPHQTRNLGLMHREDHRGRRAGAAERIEHVGDIEDRRAVAAERFRNLDAQQPLGAGESCQAEYGGSFWTVRNDSDRPIPSGGRARIERVQDLTLLVKPDN